MLEYDLARYIREAAQEVFDWASSPENSGPHQYEIYTANAQIHAALNRLADKLDKAS